MRSAKLEFLKVHNLFLYIYVETMICNEVHHQDKPEVPVAAANEIF